MSEEAKKKNILVVEDDPEMLPMIVEGLKACEAYRLEVEGVTGPREYLQRDCCRKRYDLALLDLWVKGWSFPQNVHIVQDVAFEHPGTPIIVYSAYPQIENVVKAMQYGATDFIYKADIPPHELAQRVVAFFDERAEKLRRHKELERLLAERHDEWLRLYAGQVVIIVGQDVVAWGSSRMAALVKYGDLFENHKGEWPDHPEDIIEIHAGEDTEV